MTLTERLHRARHWQLFMLTFGVVFIFYVYMMISFISTISIGTPPEPQEMFQSFMFFPIVIIIASGTHFCWYWSIGIGLQNKLPAEARMKTGLFKVAVLFPAIYFVIIFIGITYLFTNAQPFFDQSDPTDLNFIQTIAFSMLFFVPLHFFAIFCSFYCLYFTAKTIKSIELQRAVTLSDYIAEFVLIWFFPVGVWIIQPKINKMTESDQPAT